MNLVSLCFSRSWGGLEHNCAYDAVLMAERGHNLLSIAYPDTPLAKHLERNKMPHMLMTSRDYFSPLTTLKLMHAFTQNKIDALHFHRTQDLAPALLAADLAGVKTRVLTLRMESKRKKHDLFHRWVYNRLTTVATITERLRGKVTLNVSVDPKKVRRLYNGVDIENLRQEAIPKANIREKWGIEPDAYVVGIVGRIEPGKGQHVLIKAVEKLTGQIPKLRVMIVGDETIGQKGEKQRLKELTGELGLNGKVIFTGFQRPAGKIIPGFDVSVLATKKETFGTVILEAQALSIPVIATNAGGVPEIISHEHNGLLVTPEDPGELSDAILRLYENPKMRLEIVSRGLDNVRSRFSIRQHADELERILLGHQ